VLGIAAALEVIAGPDGTDPRQYAAQSYKPGELTRAIAESSDKLPPEESLVGVRVGVLDEGFDWPQLSLPAVDSAVRSAAERLRYLGATVQTVSIPQHRDARHLFAPIMSEGSLALLYPLNQPGSEGIAQAWPGAGASIREAWAERAGELPVSAKVAFLAGQLAREETGGEIAALARSLVTDLTRAYDRVFASVDVIVMPTQPGLATQFPGKMEADEFIDVALRMSVNTCATNLTGHPALTVPCGSIDGLPVGMLIVSRLGADAAVLKVGHAFQTHVFRMPPPGGV